MEHTRFIGLDIHKERISIAVAESGRSGAVEYLGEVANDPGAISKLCDRLGRPGRPLAFCYEAGPCGYGVYRQLKSLGHRCDVVAPSLIPMKPGDRVKTDRRDATMLARLHRAGELTPVWVPDADHEAMRDLIRLRSVVRQIVTRTRQHLQGFLLRHGRKHGQGTAWRMAYRRWLSTLAFQHPAQQIAFQDYVDAVMDAERRLQRVEEQISCLLPEWNLRPVVDALQAMRGIALINAVVLVAEVGDFTRFSSPRQLMAYFGLVPGEQSSGETIRHTGITKTGNSHARRALVEGAWAYRMKPRIGRHKVDRIEALPKIVRDIGWKAQVRLCARYRRLAVHKSVEAERNALAHGHFGTYSLMLDALLWLSTADYIGFKATLILLGDRIYDEDKREKLNSSLSYYKAPDLESIFQEIDLVGWLWSDFIAYLQTLSPEARAARYRELCDRPRVAQELVKLRQKNTPAAQPQSPSPTGDGAA